MSRQLVVGDLASQDDGVARGGVALEERQAPRVGAPAHDDQARARDPLGHARPGLDEGVLALAGHEPGDAHDRRCIAQAVPLAQRGAGGGVGVEALDVDAAGKVDGEGARCHEGAQAAERVLGDVGDDVGVAEDAAQELARSGQHGPADLVPVGGGDDAARPGPLRGAAEQSERGGGAEPDGLDTALGDDPLHPAAHVRRGQEHMRGHAHDVEGDLGVEGAGRLGSLRGSGGQDGQVRGRQAAGVVIEVGLDPADDGREVIRDEECPAHTASLDGRVASPRRRCAGSRRGVGRRP